MKSRYSRHVCGKATGLFCRAACRTVQELRDAQADANLPLLVGHAGQHNALCNVFTLHIHTAPT